MTPIQGLQPPRLRHWIVLALVGLGACGASDQTYIQRSEAVVKADLHDYSARFGQERSYAATAGGLSAHIVCGEVRPSHGSPLRFIFGAGSATLEPGPAAPGIDRTVFEDTWRASCHDA